ncbi:MAG: hypothetical protein KVP18_001862 [Porospora cf. gigantea A]|nr:MAG: hypothetical protein KVP18_001862 [Porospora cf. gigantea A]
MSSCGSDDYCYDDPEITPSDGYLFKILNRSYNRRPSEASDTKFMRSVISAMTTPDHLSSIQSCPTNNPNSKETLRTFNEACEDLAAIQPRKEVIEPDVVLPTTRFRGNRYLQLGLAIMNAFSGKSSLRNAWDNIRRAALRIQRPIVGKESAKDRLPFRTDPS